jgi:hypothetical protein
VLPTVSAINSKMSCFRNVDESGGVRDEGESDERSERVE